MPQEDFLTAAEVAAELRLHPVTVQKLCRDGKLQCSRVGRSYRIPWDSYEDFKRGLMIEARPVALEPELEPELASLVTGWLRHLESGPWPCSPETIRNYRRHLLRYVKDLLGADPGATLTYREAASEKALLRVITRILVSQYATRYSLFMSVMSFARFLAERDMLDKHERARTRRHKPRRLGPANRTALTTTDEVNRLFEAARLSEASSVYEKTLNAAAPGVMVFAGLRASKAVRLEVGDVDLRNCILYWRAAGVSELIMRVVPKRAAPIGLSTCRVQWNALPPIRGLRCRDRKPQRPSLLGAQMNYHQRVGRPRSSSGWSRSRPVAHPTTWFKISEQSVTSWPTTSRPVSLGWTLGLQASNPSTNTS